ncbi:MAG: hypothetical protein KC420_04850 [Myxococcales bacterium]|nr:hypothetical protein [Myxococcales bacterium]MCB9706812.1 hypothetical protein [Myxococcales bacterium]
MPEKTDVRLLLDRLRAFKPSRRVHLLLGLVLPMIALVGNLWQFRIFTIDDAYISFRYARNLADGLGLVYNAGEYIEGYTNFLWTLLLALEAAIGLDPVVMSKVMGGASACGTLYFTYRLAERLLPFGLFPCVATWLLATSTLCAGYSVFGLETAFFTLLVTAGAYLVYREEESSDARALPWSGLVFAAAGLTRPEAPLFLGLVMLTLGRRFLSRRNIVRGLLFVVPIGLHLLWRKAYYGDWLPATLYAKTGDLERQLHGGLAYMKGYLDFLGPISWLGLVGAVIGVLRRSREAIAAIAITVLFTGYIILVGGDWMPHHRFVAPIEPFFFLLIGLGVRRIAETRNLLLLALIVLGGVFFGIDRTKKLNKTNRRFVVQEYRGHMATAGAASDWLEEQPPGKIAIGDIGLVGYRTNFPLLDTLGLVDPVISRLPGGYTQKLGKGFTDRIFGEMPAYIVIIVNGDCDRPVMAGSRLIYNDPRFAPNYFTGHRIRLGGDANWCIYEHRKHREKVAAAAQG